MAYIAPTSADLLARFPEFAGTSGTTIQALLDDAGADVGEAWIETDRARATLALAAHMLALSGALGAESGVGPGATTSEVRAGDTMIKFAVPTAASGTNAASYAQTSYGQRFLELRSRSFPAVAVV